MAKKKEPFIKKSLRPNLEINPNKKISDLTIRELSSILGEKSRTDINQSNLMGGILKRILDSKPFKDYKDNKDDIHEGPLVTQNIDKKFDALLKRITGLENEIKKLKKK